MPKHIGIVGVSPEGSAFCYRLIGRRASEIADASRRPSITLHNQPFSTFIEALRRNDWESMGRMLSESAAVLARAGADFCVLPDNVAHHALHLAEANSTIPWVNMIDLVADVVVTNKCQRVGLIGTKYVTSGSTYQTALGLKKVHLLVPEEDDADAIDRIIFSEAVYGMARPESKSTVARAIDKLGRRGCDAVIMASSEASVLLTPESPSMPVFDPVAILAEAAVGRANA